MQRKQPNYDRMTPEFAEVARPQAEHVEGLIGVLGTPQSITFKSVGPSGFDIYEVKFHTGHSTGESCLMLTAESPENCCVRSRRRQNAGGAPGSEPSLPCHCNRTD